MKLLVLGGSFNPVHIGHLILAEEVAVQFGYDRVLLVPAFAPPHKALVEDPGPEERLAMLSLAVAKDPLFAIDDSEIRRGGPSYTIDTLAKIACDSALEGKPALVIGDDLADGFSSWRRPEEILRLADLIVARRSGKPFQLEYPYRLAGNLLIPISSTMVRDRVRMGGAWKWLVPEAVAHHIEKHGLYGLS
ncbi:MAG: nicotinate (nicotinamide) nucleotide adenylyltransferase [Spirochaetales bacterium]|nr:MAG: nicotinate (nicotinamide) nucleotide adenylyltransferase [Spirochaetales bacterium]